MMNIWILLISSIGILGGMGSFLSYLKDYGLDIIALKLFGGILIICGISTIAYRFYKLKCEVKKRETELEFASRKLATLTEVFSENQQANIETWSDYYKKSYPDYPSKYHNDLREKLHNLYPALFSNTSPPKNI